MEARLTQQQLLLGQLLAVPLFFSILLAPEFPSMNEVEQTQSAYEVQVDKREAPTSAETLTAIRNVLLHPSAAELKNEQTAELLQVIGSVQKPSEEQAKEILESAKPGLNRAGKFRRIFHGCAAFKRRLVGIQIKESEFGVIAVPRFVCCVFSNCGDACIYSLAKIVT